jgi:acyltransferase
MVDDSVFSNAITQVKGLAILLVVLGHISSPFGVAIFSFHIPLFFFLGGVFIKPDYPFPYFLRRNLIRLIVPYLIFGALGLVVNDVKNVLLHRPLEDFFHNIAGLLFWMDASRLKHYGMVLWFLPALFWARMFCYGLVKYLKLNELLVFSLCVACAYRFSNLADYLPFGLDKGMVALPWVLMGSVFNRHRESILTLPMWQIAPVALLVYLIVCFYGMPRLDMASKNLDHFFVTLPYTLSVIVLIAYATYHANFWGFAPLKEIPAWIGKFGSQSMLVYIAHPYTNNAAYLLITHFLGEGYWFAKFCATAAMLMALIHVRLRFQNFPVFKYL